MGSHSSASWDWVGQTSWETMVQRPWVLEEAGRDWGRLITQNLDEGKPHHTLGPHLRKVTVKRMDRQNRRLGEGFAKHV